MISMYCRIVMMDEQGDIDTVRQKLLSKATFGIVAGIDARAAFSQAKAKEKPAQRRERILNERIAKLPFGGTVSDIEIAMKQRGIKAAASRVNRSKKTAAGQISLHGSVEQPETEEEEILQ